MGRRGLGRARHGSTRFASPDRSANLRPGNGPVIAAGGEGHRLIAAGGGAEDTVSVGELEGHLTETIRQLRGRGRPLVVTQNGKAAAVLLSPEAFDRLTAQARFVAAVQVGLADQEAGRVVEDDELDRRLDARFGALL